MGPTKRSRSLNKRLSHINEVSTDKYLEYSKKHQQRKKRLYDKLGPRWNEQEIERFYDAYRKYGYDWKKVAAAVRTRSREMVEALYLMNRAYLSLPDGTATVRGLIAMMIDHYHAQLEGSESEKESNDVSCMYHRPPKSGNLYADGSNDLLQSQPAFSSDGCLSFLKGKQPMGRVVGKRTPRFPVYFSYKKDLRTPASPKLKDGRYGNMENDNEDDDEHAAALALAEASQRGGSPQHSKTPSGRGIFKSQCCCGEDKIGLAEDKFYVAAGSCRVEHSKNLHYEHCVNSFVDMEEVGTVELNPKGKKMYGKRENLAGVTDMDDCREACSGTGEDLNVKSINETFDIEVTGQKVKQCSPMHGTRSKKRLLDEEVSDFYALQTLADLSLTASTIESESPVRVVNKVTIPEGEATSTSYQHEGPRYALGRTIHSNDGVEMPIARKHRHSREFRNEIEDLSGPKSQAQCSKPLKRKRKPSLSEVVTAADLDSHVNGSFEAKNTGENRASNKGKRSCQVSPLPKGSKGLKPDMPIGVPFLNDELRISECDKAFSSKAPQTSQSALPMKTQSRRKLDKKRLIKTLGELSERSSKDLANRCSSSLHEKEKLSACLFSSLVRKWCVYEWFYSATDYPWFARNEFVEYLHHAGLGHIPRLTRVEWGVIRSSLGKPRRFSDQFLHEEKGKLNLYRDAVRKHYSELRAGISDGLPTDLPRPISVGQRVIAIHPKTREVHDGNVLTVDRDNCRIQFDHPELGVEIVMDVECMPLNPLENMPESLRRQNTSLGKFSPCSKESMFNGRFNESMMFTPIEHRMKVHKNSSNPSMMMEPKVPSYNAVSQAAVRDSDASYAPLIHFELPHDHANKSDVQSLCELSLALEKKESLLMELRQANNDIIESQQNGDIPLKESESFKRHYATILVELKEASDQVSAAVLQLRNHNTYRWLKQPALSNGHCGSMPHTFSMDSQEATANVLEIVKNCRLKAYTMVDVAIRAMAAIDDGEDAFFRVSEALTSLRKSEALALRSPEVNGDLVHHNQLKSCLSESQLATYISSSKVSQESDKEDTLIPHDLVTSCVAALMMIQMCTERQYPPADVAQVIDLAVTCLQPTCCQNLPIFREIQMCMGRIKTQILALVPT